MEKMWTNTLIGVFCAVFLLPAALLPAQITWTEPAFPRPDQPVTVYFDARQGTAGLKDCGCTVYVHTGLITDQSLQPSDWKNVVSTWGVANPAWAMTPVAGSANLYKFEIKPNIRGFYGVSTATQIRKLAFVFRNANGTREGKDTGGKDVFIDVFSGSGLLSAINTPGEGANLVVKLGNTIPFSGKASEAATLSLIDNGVVLRQVTGIALDYTIGVVSSGTHIVEFVAETAAEKVVKRFTYVVAVEKPALDPPPGTQPGIARVDANTVRLALYAPAKPAIFVTGNFNDWSLSDTFLMNRSVDGTLHWIDIPNAPAGKDLLFQYVIEGGRRMGDPYSKLVLDPDNDRFIPTATFPGIPSYPIGRTQGIVSWVRPELPYPWKSSSFAKPPKQKLVVYELLLRDFIGRHDYQTLTDTLNYLQRLGVNAIELMPVNEFEGNESWGYNPSYHLALDKYYGTPEQFKAFVDACHQRGIAVILDVVFNHAFDQSPLCQLYWDADLRRPAADNPWLNPTPRHDFNVGHDFNHESPATRSFVKRALEYWVKEFRVDGFRFDLSKGFTQTLTIGNSSAMAQFDPSRVAILNDYANHVWAQDPSAYVIMEHFADNTEETRLTNAGMMVWANLNYAFNEATMGYTSNLSALDYRNRGWVAPGAIAYAESHDEERLMYKNLQFGNASPDGSYRVRNLETALARQELATVFLYGIPGPRMLWQFGELGYDFSINTCTDGTVNGCRLANKPIRWDYRSQAARQKLYDITRIMLELRRDYPVFHTTDFRTDLAAPFLKSAVLRHPDFEVALAGNFGVTTAPISISMPGVSKLYEYFTGDSISLSGGSFSLSYLPGQYRLFTTRKLPPPVRGSLVTGLRERQALEYRLEVYPNPARGQVSIRYELPETMTVRAELYDFSGQLVSLVFVGRQAAGPQNLEWDAGTIPAGAYILRIAGATGQASRVLVLRP